MVISTTSSRHISWSLRARITNKPRYFLTFTGYLLYEKAGSPYFFTPHSAMKVLLINTSESVGGAAIACRRLFSALRHEGVNASLLVRDKTGLNHHVHTLTYTVWDRLRNKLNFLYERAIIFLNNGLRRNRLFAVSLANSGISLANHPDVREADIIHLHWVNQGMLSLVELQKLLQLGKPIVWTLHDMWPITAICHHARSCTRYADQCDACPQLNDRTHDLSFRYFKRKELIYTSAPITFVGCSQWLAQLARNSRLTRNGSVHAIPNPIDTNRFYPSDSEAERLRLGLPVGKRLLLFGALNLTDPRKGISFLIEALRTISMERSDIELVVFGHVKQELQAQLPFKIHPMGYLTSREQIIALYNAVDLFVTPSLEENLPNTIMEAMACGTPCVGFNIGGIPEMIDHRTNGYVAEYGSSDDLATGLLTTLHPDNYDNYAREARNKAVTCYSEATVARQYIQLYKERLDL